MKKILFLLSMINILFLTGCWDYHEIEDFGVATSVSVDMDDNSGYHLVAELIEIVPSKTSLNFNTTLIESHGKTIFEAIRNMIPTANRRIFWGHTQVFYIGEEVAKDGIGPILDWVMRDPLPRPTMHFYISKNQKARDIIEKENKSSKIRNFEFEKTIKSFKYVSKSPHSEAYRIANHIVENNFYTVVPTVEIESAANETVGNMSGSAFFKGDKFVDYLDPLETMKYLFIVNEIKGGLLVIDVGKEFKDKVTLEILNNKTKLNSDIRDDEITITLDMKTHVSIFEIDNHIDYTSIEGRAQLKEEAEKFMEKEIKEFIQKMQKDYGIDIFKFADYIRKNHPSEWKKMENDWESVFKDLNIEVNSTIYIEGSGHISKPLKPGE